MGSLTRIKKFFDPKLIKNGTAVGPGASVQVPQNLPNRTFAAVLTGTGVISATVIVEVCNDDATWETLGTITLSSATKLNDGFKDDGAWQFVRGRIAVISGTNAKVNLTMGI